MIDIDVHFYYISLSEFIFSLIFSKKLFLLILINNKILLYINKHLEFCD